MKNVEIIDTISTSVSCFGKEPPFDHPKVYLEIDQNKWSIMCHYCGKNFVLNKEDDS